MIVGIAKKFPIGSVIFASNAHPTKANNQAIASTAIVSISFNHATGKL